MSRRSKRRKKAKKQRASIDSVLARGRRLLIEQLEERRMLALTTVSTPNDILDGDTSSIAALNADPGSDREISLREAIIAANQTVGLDQIEFSAALDGKRIDLSIRGSGEDGAFRGDLDITDDVIIVGNGIANTLISAGGEFGLGDRVFQVLSKASATLSGLSVTGGYNVTGNGQGGGILVEDGNLVLSNTTVSGNLAKSGGGVDVVSMNSPVSLVINASRITDNVAESRGGGLAILADGDRAGRYKDYR